MRCPQCNRNNPKNAALCTCGYDLEMMRRMKCPVCKLQNPPGAMRCDCGYDFDTGTVKDSFLPQSDFDEGKYQRDKMLSSMVGGVLGSYLNSEVKKENYRNKK